MRHVVHDPVLHYSCNKADHSYQQTRPSSGPARCWARLGRTKKSCGSKSDSSVKGDVHFACLSLV
jgi:hypothetical protein